MPTLYKIANLDLSKIKSIPVNLELKTPCPKCRTTMHYYFMSSPLEHPEKDQRLNLVFGCGTCNGAYGVPARIMNTRVVIAYDLEKIKELK